MQPLPRRHRLPGPPPVFVGRADETNRLTRILERSPLAFVSGPGGLGKTALVLYAIHTRHPEHVGATLFASVREGEPLEQLRRDLLEALSSIATAGHDIDLAGLSGDPEAQAMALIDVAEETGVWIVLDDLHHCKDPGIEDLLRLISSYGRTGRWIVTSRLPARAEALAGTTVELGVMPDADLAELARELEPRRDGAEIGDAVISARGSPWVLRQHLAHGATSAIHTRKSMLAGLSQEAVDALRTLALVRLPLRLDQLAQLTAPPSDEELEVLQRRGLLFSTGAGLRVHELAASVVLEERGTTNVDRVRLAQRLCELGEPEAELEAIAQLLAAGEPARVLPLLETHGDELVALGFSARLWQVLEPLDDPSFVPWKLRCAAELGNITVLDALRKPSLATDRERLAWATALYLMGDPDAAGAALAGLHGSDDAETRVESIRLAARCRSERGDLHGATELLDACRDGGARVEAQRAVIGALRAEPGTLERALRLAAALSARPDVEADLDAATALHELGQRELAWETLDRIAASPRGRRAALLVGRRAMLLRARLHLDAGELAEAERLLDLVRPYTRGSSILRAPMLELDAVRRLAMGEVDEAGRLAERGLALAVASSQPCATRLTALGRRIRRLKGAGVGRDDAARRAFASGDLLDALEHACRARESANVAGRRLDEAEALHLTCDLYLCLGRNEALEEARDALSALATRTGSPRFAAEASYYDRIDSPAALEEAASAMPGAPVATRRARAQLGGSPALDGCDRAVLAAIDRRRSAWRIETLGAASAGSQPNEWEPGWGIDERMQSAWVDGGRTLDFTRRAVPWRILCTLFERGGHCGKEELVEGVWGEREYHPLRHDAKLHVAIRALRRELENDPAAPRRLLTTEAGYRLGGVVRRIGAASK